MTEVALVPNDALLREETIEVEVTRKVQASLDISTLTLQATSGADLPSWEPGAHVDLLLPDGLVRQYSLCGSTSDLSSYRIGVLRDPASRGGSAYLHETLREGDRLHLRGPRNHFELLPAQRYVFVAGGIGVTPLVPMTLNALAAGVDFEFIYCARNREAMAFADELEDALGSRLTLNADDKSGVFDLAGYFADVQPDTLVYACGPGPFLDAVVRATKDWPSGTIHFERFEPLNFDATTNASFEVELASSGEVLTVPADRSILSVLSENGVRVLSSCTEGTCGTCEVGVVGGGETIEHRDAVLSPEERASGEMLMVCVSRCAGGRLLLDL